MKGAFELRPEQWVLFGAFIVLGAVALIKAFTLPDIDTTSGGGKKNQPETYDTTKIETISERWNQSPVIKETDHKVYVSRLIVFEPATKEIKPLSDEGVIKGMKVWWLKKYDLSLEDPNVDIADPDQDGFSNVDEFKKETVPVDAESHPPFVEKLCLKEYEFIPFKMEFKGYNPDPSGEGFVYSIKLPEVRGKSTRMVKQGSDVEGYEIGEFRKKIVTRINPRTGTEEQVNESELDVIHPILKTPVTLIYDTVIESDESRVVFQLNVPNMSPEPSSVKRGETFKIKDLEFQFMSATADTAVIRQVDTDQEFTITKCGE